MFSSPTVYTAKANYSAEAESSDPRNIENIKKFDKLKSLLSSNLLPSKLNTIPSELRPLSKVSKNYRPAKSALKYIPNVPEDPTASYANSGGMKTGGFFPFDRASNRSNSLYCSLYIEFA